MQNPGRTFILAMHKCSRDKHYVNNVHVIATLYSNIIMSSLAD